MTVLDAVKTNGQNGHVEPATRAWNAHLARIERRLAEVAESGEQRVAILRDALADFTAAELAQRDHEIVTLKKHIAELEHKLEQKTAVDEQVHEIAARLEEKAARRDEAKRGPPGLKGPKGDKGDRGAPGRNGISKVQTVTIKNWAVDSKTFTVTAELSDGTFAPLLNLRPLFEEYHVQVGG
jgi:hypothetical protein